MLRNPANGVLLDEYTTAFLPLILDSYKWLAMLKPLCTAFNKFLLIILTERGFFRLDMILSRLFGGYLLTSVIASRQKPPTSSGNHRPAAA
jgi:hypothetical protein